jgi:signal peptidase I
MASVRTCSSCGFNNPESRDRCFRCRTALADVVAKDASHLADRGPDRIGQGLAALRHAEAAASRWWDRLNVFPQDAPYRYPAACALLSLAVPGAGQLRNGQRSKALLALAIAVPFWVWIVMTFYEPNNHWIMVGYLVYALLVAADAYMTALKINGRFVWDRYLFAYWFGFIAMAGMLMSTAQFWAYPLGIHLVTVTGTDLEPGLHHGDKLLVWRWTGTFGSLPSPGSVVYIAPKAFTMTRPGGDLTQSTTLVVHPIRTFGVVTGEAGDHITRTGADAPLLLNGAPMPKARLPLVPGSELQRLDLKVPKDHIAVLPSGTTSELVTKMAIGVSAPTPAQGEAAGLLVAGYSEAALLDASQVHGRALFRYHPPQRRQWFGSKGLWGGEASAPR